MSQSSAIAAKCVVCGRAIHNEKSDLVGSPWETSVCAVCGRQRMLDDGGVMVRRRQPIKDAQFDIKDVYIKPGALHYLTESHQHCWPFVEDHARIGATINPQDDLNIDRIPFLEGGGHRVSQHKTAKDKKLWIMTDQQGVTVVMAPGEF
jgi:hypothetical protein